MATLQRPPPPPPARNDPEDDGARPHESNDDLHLIAGQRAKETLPGSSEKKEDVGADGGGDCSAGAVDVVAAAAAAAAIDSVGNTTGLQPPASSLQGRQDELSSSAGVYNHRQHQHHHHQTLESEEQENESNQQQQHHHHHHQPQQQPPEEEEEEEEEENSPTVVATRPTNINTGGHNRSPLIPRPAGQRQHADVTIPASPPPSIVDAYYNYQPPADYVFYDQNAPDVEESLRLLEIECSNALVPPRHAAQQQQQQQQQQTNGQISDNLYGGGDNNSLDQLVAARSPALPDADCSPLCTSFDQHQLFFDISSTLPIFDTPPPPPQPPTAANMQAIRNVIRPVRSTLSVMRAKPSRYYYRSEREFWQTHSTFEDQINDEDPVPRPFGKIPGPRALPLLGNIWRYLPYVGVYNIEKLDANGRYNLARYGKIVREEVSKDHRIVWLFDPANMDELFQQEGRYPCRRSHRALLKYRQERPNMYRSGGIFPENGAEWARLRDLFKQHFLLRRNIDAYTGELACVANDLVSFVEARLDPVGRECVDFQEDLYRWALESICLIMLDARIGCLDARNLAPDSDASRLIEAAHETIDAVMRTELYNDWETKSRPTKDYLRLVNGQNVMAEIVDKHLERKLNKVQHGQAQSDQVQRLPTTLLDRFIKSGDVDRKDLFAMILDFVLAGIDTTSITAGFALYYLAKHQDVQERVRREIVGVIGNRPIHAEDFAQMPLLRACIKETMRLRPISVGVGRLANADITIGGYQVPKDTMLITMNQVSCRLDEYFENANKFQPERWLKKEGAAAGGAAAAAEKTKKDFRNRFLWLPFGHGPRMCMGRRIAELEMNILLCTILRRYQVNYHHEDIGVKTSLINVPDRPMKFQLIRLGAQQQQQQQQQL